jgi:hypothetical protein
LAIKCNMLSSDVGNVQTTLVLSIDDIISPLLTNLMSSQSADDLQNTYHTPSRVYDVNWVL